MLTLIIAIFIIGYLMIALEHPLKINKAASALLTGTILWVLYIMNAPDFESLVSSDGFKSFVQDPHAAGLSLLEQCQQYIVEHQILISIGEICQTLIFLIGAMIIVELVDVHGGFEFITNRITTRKARSLLIMISVLTFFMSSVLDNLTTSIVMIMLVRKIIADQKTRWLFGSMIIIAANSGGAWSPIGDVTTIMLWIKGNISTSETIPHLILPSLVSMFVPLFLMARQLKGSVESPIQEGRMENNSTCCTDEFFILAHRERLYIFILGILCLLFVPVFKMVTHLPPFMGVMIGVSILWFFTEFIYGKKEDLEEDRKLRVSKVVHRIDGATLLFFLGILLAVEVLRYTGILGAFASWLDDSVGNVFIVNMVIGALSAVVDNVPLVAGAMGMYPVMTEETVAASADPIYWMNFVQDGTFWQFLAYCAGVGGSMLIIGSAAGVVVMGLEQISFGWYLKRISGLALLGYLAGAFVYILQCVVF
ncbi:sodium:proton antiporter NhaD [Parabacteroides sp. AD58]|uniref:Sodium:proton antiporter NhaD n=1 Tax=Parabacteroides absconsus TaxID=2951805 RepID=A0ABZ2IQ16_9BACT|nr:sodium:proton antiporter NhaD [Parabacteroides sp. AD58]MCM6902799.1 sodium:proton antiporter NhaD [Parabacteroides sp. AD58]